MLSRFYIWFLKKTLVTKIANLVTKFLKDLKLREELKEENNAQKRAKKLDDNTNF